MIDKLRTIFPLLALAAVSCGDESAAGIDDVVINEVFVKSSVEGNLDWVELFNKGDAEVDLTGWMIKDSKDRDPYVFADTVLGSGAYLVIERDETGSKGFTFGLGNADAVRLFEPGGEMVDRASWDDNSMLEDKSLGRSPDGTGELTVLSKPTKGAANEQ